MGISPVDKSKEFTNSGMTLITEVHSDVYLKRSIENKKLKKETNDYT